MSLADLRKELKEMRKSAMPTPVSRMKKTDVARELERLKGLHRAEEKMTHESHKAEEKAVAKEMKKESVPKKTAEKVSAVEKKAHKVEEAKEKKAHKVEESAVKPSKYIKGSAEAREHMAKIRSLRKSKKDE